MTTPATMTKAVPRGVRNKNPGNIRDNPKVQWIGQTGKDDLGFCIFDTEVHGIRACAKLFLNYQKLYHLLTVSSLISRWAPASENNTAAYVKSVANHMGRTPVEILNLHDAMILEALVTAVFQHENGQQPYDKDTIRQGIFMALAT